MVSLGNICTPIELLISIIISYCMLEIVANYFDNILIEADYFNNKPLRLVMNRD